MIIDFGCREALGAYDYFVSVFPGAVAILIVVAGLGLIGNLFFKKYINFQACNIFVGWGIVAALMTVAAILFVKPLLFLGYGIFGLMLLGFIFSVNKRILVEPFWILAIFPSLFILAVINAVGLGGYSYDDFSHWVPNALFVFQHNDVPSKELASVHSIYPGYPNALSFLTYLASIIAGGFLVQGGAMINFLLLFVFAAMLVQMTAGKEKTFAKNRPIKTDIWWKISFALLLGVFLNSSIATFGITNQGDTGTMVLCSALGLLFWRLIESFQLNIEEDIQHLSLKLSLTAIAFILLKESNVVLFLLLIFAFLIIALKSDVLKQAVMKLPIILFPALSLCLIWQYYARLEIGGGGVNILPISSWRFDLLGPLFEGIWREVKWKSPFFVLFLGTISCGFFSLFRSAGGWRNFAFLASIVQIGYAIFLIAVFLGSDFSEYTVRLAASFHRYMLHSVFLAIPTFWLAASALWPYIKNQNGISAVCSSQLLCKSGTLLSILTLPLIMFVKSDWIVMRPDPDMCHMRKLAYVTALALPHNSRLGAIFPTSDGFAAFVASLGLAFEEAQTGRKMSLVWHTDSFHTFIPPTTADVEQQLKTHPDTNALIFSPDAVNLIEGLGMKDTFGSGFLIREGNEWKSKILFVPNFTYWTSP